MIAINHASSGKRDLHNLEQEYDNSIIKLNKEKWNHLENKKAIIEYLQDCQIGFVKSGKSNKRISKATLYRILGILRLFSENWLNKDFKKATQKDYDDFYKQMEQGKIKNARGETFKQGSRAKNYKTIRKFLRWYLNNDEEYPSVCKKWVTVEGTVQKIHLTIGEVQRLVQATNRLRNKTLIMMLFDGGFRIEELTNIRWADVKLSKKGYYQIHIRDITSKTKKERYVTIPLCTDLIKSYRKNQEPIKEDDYLFPLNYQSIYMNIRALGKRILNKNTSPHTLRHSSATYYADILKTFQQFCTRYGWALNSNEAQRYYHSVNDDMITEDLERNEINKYKYEMEKMKIDLAHKEEQMNNMEKRFNKQLDHNKKLIDKVLKTLDKKI